MESLVALGRERPMLYQHNKRRASQYHERIYLPCNIVCTHRSWASSWCNVRQSGNVSLGLCNKRTFPHQSLPSSRISHHRYCTTLCDHVEECIHCMHTSSSRPGGSASCCVCLKIGLTWFCSFFIFDINGDPPLIVCANVSIFYET